MTIDFVKEQGSPKDTKSNWDTIKVKKKTILEHNRTSHFKKNSIIISNQIMNESESSDLTIKINLKDIIDRE